MIKFLKENSYDIFKLFLSQIALAIFALIMTMWTANINDSVFFYVGLFFAPYYGDQCFWLRYRNRLPYAVMLTHLYLIHDHESVPHGILTVPFLEAGILSRQSF